MCWGEASRWKRSERTSESERTGEKKKWNIIVRLLGESPGGVAALGHHQLLPANCGQRIVSCERQPFNLWHKCGAL